MSDASLIPPAGFRRSGPATPDCPVVIAVPHAGRVYPPALIAAARTPVGSLAALEDRLVDRLVEPVLSRGVTGFIAERARAWIDLNRDEREIDPAMIMPPPSSEGLIASARMRGGLGLIPRRLTGIGDIWRGGFAPGDISERIATDHRPYHAAIAETLERARARFGIAILLDCHSMPSLAATVNDPAPPNIVIGDRHGRSAGDRLVTTIEQIARSAGLRSARNTPYAGGHTLDKHGQPRRDIHAIQIEFDRALYLSADGASLSAGSARLITLIGEIVETLASDCDSTMPIAAE